MAKDLKRTNHLDQRATSEPPDRPTGPLSIPVSMEARDEVKVNNANVTELKNACDDAVKRVSVLGFFSLCLFLANWFGSSSTSHDQICSNRFMYIRMYDWVWVG
jgi:hypothetical protein